MRTDIDNSRGYRQIDPRAEHISDQRESNSADNSAGDSAKHSTAGIQATPEQAESQAAFTTTGIQTSKATLGFSQLETIVIQGSVTSSRTQLRRDTPLGFRSATSISRIQNSSIVEDSTPVRSTTEIQASDNTSRDSVRTNSVLDFGPAKQPVRVSQSIRAIAKIQKSPTDHCRGLRQALRAYTTLLRDSRQQEIVVTARATAPQQRTVQRQLQQAGGQAKLPAVSTGKPLGDRPGVQRR